MGSLVDKYTRFSSFDLEEVNIAKRKMKTGKALAGNLALTVETASRYPARSFFLLCCVFS
jgi:hypothetical protein